MVRVRVRPWADFVSRRGGRRRPREGEDLSVVVVGGGDLGACLGRAVARSRGVLYPRGSLAPSVGGAGRRAELEPAGQIGASLSGRLAQEAADMAPPSRPSY